MEISNNVSTQTAYLAATLWNQTVYLQMLKNAFVQLDQSRDYLSQAGSWMNDTASLQRWSQFDSYA